MYPREDFEPHDYPDLAPLLKKVEKRILSEIELLKREIFILRQEFEKFSLVFIKGDSKNSIASALADPLYRYIAGYVAWQARPVSPAEVASAGGWITSGDVKAETEKNCSLVKKIRACMNQMVESGILVSRGKRKKKFDLSFLATPFREEFKAYFKENSSNPPQP